MRDAFGPMWEYAHDVGLDVYFRTDMLALTTPLEEYLVERFGGLATEDPEFWDVYAAGLDELYAAMPYLDGVLIRIGEAGRVYDLPGWDYYSDARRHDGRRRCARCSRRSPRRPSASTAR